MFGLMLFQARRFIEYFPPFALLFAAFAWAPVISRYGQETRGRLHRLLPALALLLVLLPGAWNTFQAARDSLRDSKPYTTYAGAAGWLADNTPAGARVFQTDWDDFPRLFFYNTHNTYLIGLDPTYMQIYDPELYDLWAAITRGKVEDPGALIAQEFGARYIISDLRHPAFLEQAAQDARLEEVYRDDSAVVLVVK
jgi:hypothetical protein